MREVINFRKLESGEVTSVIYKSVTEAAKAHGLTAQAITTAIIRGNNSPRGQESTWDYLFEGSEEEWKNGK